MDTLPIPDLRDENILRAVCDVRPCRTGGFRLEADTLKTSDGGVGGIPLVHNYGHGGCGVTLGWGTAERAADLTEQALGVPGSAHPSHVLVLGGGVVGLTTAHELLTRGHRVTVLAKQFATDTTSNVAGALWLPTGIDFPEPGPKRDDFNQILRNAHARFTTLDPERWGVETLPVYEPESTPYFPEFFESGAIARPEPLDRLPFPGEPIAGRVFRTLFIHTPRFLNVLRGEVESHGGRLETREFTSLGDIADEADARGAHAVVNCLGLGSGELIQDAALYPARGVLVHAKPIALGYVFHNGYNYVFPRSDVLVLGGCFQPGRTDTEPDQPMIDEILTKQRAIFEPRRLAAEGAKAN
ncbi:MAG: D-amino-acid oxidase [Phycisphaerales bacterium]|jgi:D-amino-acid oxidase